MSKKLTFTITAIILALLVPISTLLITKLQADNTAANVSATRTVELENAAIDYESILNEFENSTLKTEGSLTTFEGYKPIDASVLSELDNLSSSDIEQVQDTYVKYNFSYDAETNIVTLTATTLSGNVIVEIDEIQGSAFYNDNGEIDAVMNIDGEGILLSEMQDKGLIQNCGWFKRLFKKVVKAVAVVAAVVAVAAVVVATVGAAAPAVVAAGVGTATLIGTTATISTSCLTIAMVAAGISLTATAVASIDFQGVKYETKEYSKVAKELIKGFYYLAIGDKEGRMLVSPVRIPTVALAATALKSGLSVYSPDPVEAYAVAQAAGNGAIPEIDPAHQDGYFAHYHIAGRPKPSAHAFYGTPKPKHTY